MDRHFPRFRHIPVPILLRNISGQFRAMTSETIRLYASLFRFMTGIQKGRSRKNSQFPEYGVTSQKNCRPEGLPLHGLRGVKTEEDGVYLGCISIWQRILSINALVTITELNMGAFLKF
jgi:hypothetical protein